MPGADTLGNSDEDPLLTVENACSLQPLEPIAEPEPEALAAAALPKASAKALVAPPLQRVPAAKAKSRSTPIAKGKPKGKPKAAPSKESRQPKHIAPIAKSKAKPADSKRDSRMQAKRKAEPPDSRMEPPKAKAKPPSIVAALMQAPPLPPKAASSKAKAKAAKAAAKVKAMAKKAAPPAKAEEKEAPAGAKTEDTHPEAVKKAATIDMQALQQFETLFCVQCGSFKKYEKMRLWSKGAETEAKWKCSSCLSLNTSLHRGFGGCWPTSEFKHMPAEVQKQFFKDCEGFKGREAVAQALKVIEAHTTAETFLRRGKQILAFAGVVHKELRRKSNRARVKTLRHPRSPFARPDVLGGFAGKGHPWIAGVQD